MQQKPLDVPLQEIRRITTWNQLRAMHWKILEQHLDQNHQNVPKQCSQETHPAIRFHRFQEILWIFLLQDLNSIDLRPLQHNSG